MKTFATIDIGSNSLLLSIAEEISGSTYRLLVDECHVTGLAKGVKEGQNIPPDRLEKSIKVLKHYGDLIRRHQTQEVRAVATEGLRRAGNHAQAKAQLETALGYEIEMISGLREAELSFWSVQKAHPESQRSKIVFDIGGASTELILGSSQGIQKICSLKMGSVVLSDAFNLQEPNDGVAALQRVEEILSQSEFADSNLFQNTLGVGVAGTMTTLIAVDRRIEKFSRDSVHLKTIGIDSLFEARKMILAKSLEERREIIGLPHDRADVFGGGLTIAYALAKHFGWKELTCMDSGIRFGLLFELLKI